MTLAEYLKKLYTGENFRLCANRGYVLAPNTLRRCIRLSQEEKAVLYEIYSLYNEEKKYAFPTQQTLAMYVGMSSSSVSKHLKKLVEKGFISVFGKKGQKKRYVPSFSVHNNPYVVLSELFHFGIRSVNNHIPDEVGGEWANQMLQLVNLKKNEEFSEKDFFGKAVLCYSNNTFDEITFLNELLTKVEHILGIEISIEWERLIKEQKERITKRPTPPIRPRTKNSHVTRLDGEEDYFREIGWD